MPPNVKVNRINCALHRLHSHDAEGVSHERTC